MFPFKMVIFHSYVIVYRRVITRKIDVFWPENYTVDAIRKQSHRSTQASHPDVENQQLLGG